MISQNDDCRLVMKIPFRKISVSRLATIISTAAFAGSILVISAFIGGCSSGSSSYSSLKNQGILPVSPTNSYLGTNLFLGEEAEKSKILFQFLKSRGAPGAIEIVGQNFGPSRLLLYYPRQQQVYRAELSTAHKGYDWIIRGPYSIDRNDFRKLANLDRARYEDAPIIVNGKAERFGPLPVVVATSAPPKVDRAELERREAEARRIAANKKRLELAKKKAREQKAAAAEPKPTVAGVPQRQEPVLPSSGPLNSDQQALRLSRGLTELSPEGDLIHRVNAEGETLEAIAKWYTGDEAQAKTIAEHNSLSAGAAVPKGARIKIPKALAKTEQAKR